MDFDNLENDISFLKPVTIGEALRKIDYKNKKDISPFSCIIRVYVLYALKFAVTLARSNFHWSKTHSTQNTSPFLLHTSLPYIW